jgi:hypothetical protein
LKNFYQSEFASLSSLSQSQGLYSSYFGKTLTTQELNEWFSFDESNQFTYVLTDNLRNSDLTEREINSQELDQNPAALLLECDAYKKAQFRFELAGSLYNIQNRSVDDINTNEIWNKVKETQKSYNSCIYNGTCDYNNLIPWYNNAPIKIIVAETTQLEVRVPEIVNNGRLPNE